MDVPSLVDPSTRRTLRAIASDVGCKKLAHCGYDRIYPKYLEMHRDEHFTLLEVGVDGGASLRMWSEYFPNADIHGLDIDPACAGVDAGRAVVHIEDATSDKAVSLARELSPMVLIDDGSHRAVDQQRAFDALWSAVGWAYFVEDLHIWDEGGFAYALAGKAVDVMGTSRRKTKRPVHIHEYPALTVGAVHAHPGLCVLEKA